uniref:Putative secreted protein n=1 Tax=Anopheles darlingi TaxID=43151 RepID=A0A2M4DB00_ANODA
MPSARHPCRRMMFTILSTLRFVSTNMIALLSGWDEIFSSSINNRFSFSYSSQHSITCRMFSFAARFSEPMLIWM